jgi:hypothetical protein
MATTLGLNTPSTLAGMDVDTGLLQKRWLDNQIAMQSVLYDPILNATKDFINTMKVGSGKNAVPSMSSFMLNCTPKDKNGKAARSVELIFMDALDDSPQEGNASSLIGNEETLQLRYSTAYANDYFHGVAADTFGIDFRELSAYGVYQKIRPLLQQYMAELKGYYVREAVIQVRSHNLTAAPLSLSQGLNPVFYIPGLAASSQPTYDSTASDYENAVGAAANTASNSTDYRLTVHRVIAMIRYLIETKYIKPVMINGNPMLCLFASSGEFDYLRDPSVTNSWGEYYRDVAATEDLAKVVPGAKMVIGEELIVVRDPRHATMTLSGNASDYTLTFGYMKYGRTSTRETGTGVLKYDASLILGEQALAIYEPEAPHFETQGDEFRKNNNTGLFGGIGYQIPVYDLDTPTDTSAYSEGSAVILTPRT